MCDGQILVTDDIIGLSGFKPKFVKKYSDIYKLISLAVKEYAKDVKEKTNFQTNKNISMSDQKNTEIKKENIFINFFKKNKKYIFYLFLITIIVLFIVLFINIKKR